MKLALHFVATLLAVLTATSAALAQPFPNKPIRVIVGFPGSTTDLTARLIAVEMSKRVGQQIVVEGVPGASGTIAAKTVARADADGYTLLYAPPASLHPIFNKNNAVDASKELAPVSASMAVGYVFYVNAQSPYKSLQDLVAWAKSNPGRLNYGTASTIQDMVTAVLKARTGITYETVYYKGVPLVINGLLAGDVALTNSAIGTPLPNIKAGKIRALFITLPRRSIHLPDVPTAGELGMANYEITTSYGFWAPLGTAADVISKLSLAAAAAVKEPAVEDKIRNVFVAETIGSTPEEQLRILDAEMKFLMDAARLGNFQPQ